MTTNSPNCNLPPMHHGELPREDVIPALGLPPAQIDRLLGASRQALHAILRERAAITLLLALNLGKRCGNGPGLQIHLQARPVLARLAGTRRAGIGAVSRLNAA